MPNNDNGFPDDNNDAFIPAFASVNGNLILLGCCLAIMIAALVFAALYHRRPRRQ